MVTSSKLTIGSLLAAMASISFGADDPHTPPLKPAWDMYSDTWVATDGLGRTLPTFEDVGPPKADKTVAMFYYLWLDGQGGEVRDIAKILHDTPDARIPMAKSAWCFWGEPVLGYYKSDDPFVHRVHAAMLSDAGVDAVVFDATNALTYEPQYTQLCRVYEDIRGLGQATPSVGFITHAKAGRTVQKLYDDLYAKGLFNDLWFKWDGKPLAMTVPKELPPALKNFFTVRASWAWTSPTGWFGDGHDCWPWLDNYPQHYGWHESPNVPEQISVCAAQHPVSLIGRSYHDGAEPPVNQRDPRIGSYFSEQWSQALKVSPSLVFVTNFNEWIASNFKDDKPGGKPRQFMGRPMVEGEGFFVDEFSPEFSRDIEPAAPTPANKGVEDNYYYQLVAGIRRYKGVRPLPHVTAMPIKIDGKFDDWANVSPEFRDTIGDPVQRDHGGYDPKVKLINQTGRNDIIASKVSYDAANVYVYVRTKDRMTPRTDADWMVLYLDTDHDAKTGWMGYDFVLNRKGVGEKSTVLEQNIGGNYAWKSVAGGVSYSVRGNEMELAIPKRALRVSGSATIDFKWADHCFANGDWTDFTLNGDAAPNGRFNFRAMLGR